MAILACLCLHRRTELPGHTSTSEAKVTYSGEPLSAEEEQESADVAAQAKADYIASKGRGVLSVEGVIPNP
jgi:hypothetical protein